MLILLSPAKTFNFDLIEDHNTGTTSIFQRDTKALIKILQTLSEKDYQKLMKISPKLAALNKDRHLGFAKTSKKDSMQAIFAFYGDVYTSLKAEIGIIQKDDQLNFYPELRLYRVPETITSEADIKTNLFSDNLVVVNYLKDTDYLNIRYQKKPFMLLIWFSALLLGIGGLLGLRKNS